MTKKEAKEKLKNLAKAIDECEGVAIPFNIIKNIVPLRNWLKSIPLVKPKIIEICVDCGFELNSVNCLSCDNQGG